MISPNNDLPTMIVFKIVNHYVNKTAPTNYYGLGDIMRGIISTYQYCKSINCKMLIDIHEHPLTSVIEINPKYNTEIGGPVYFYGVDGGTFDTLELTSKDSVIFCNVFPNSLTEDDTEFLKSVIIVKDKYKIALPASYNVFHIRTGDFYQYVTSIPPVFYRYIELIQTHASPGDIVCSDSNTFKQLVKEALPHLKVYNEDVRGSHTGCNNSIDILRAAIEDFQIMMGASKIYTYSVYWWVSGFVEWCSKMNGIPLINLKQVI